MSESSRIVSFPQLGANSWIGDYQQDCLMRKDEATVDAYLRILRQFTTWVAERPGHGRHFAPSLLTQTSVEVYLSSLKEQGYSVSHWMDLGRGRLLSEACHDEGNACDPDHRSVYPGQSSTGERKTHATEEIKKEAPCPCSMLRHCP